MEYIIWFAEMAGKEMLRIMCEKKKVLTYVKNKANMLELILRINYGMNYLECNEREEGKKKRRYEGWQILVDIKRIGFYK